MTRHKTWSTRGALPTCLAVILLVLGWVEGRSHSSVEDDASSLKCLLRKVPPKPCVKLTGYMLPNRLIQLYENMSSEVKESIRSHKFGDLAPEAFAALPPQLFLLIPSQHMSRVSATSLTSLLKSNLHDLAVTIKIMGILNVAKAEEFFRKLEGVDLPFGLQDKIAETLVQWLPDVKHNWTFARFRMIEKVGDPLIAHVPPQFITSLPQPDIIKFLFHFRNWLWTNLPENVWNGKSESAKRAWTDAMFRSSYPVNVKRWTENEGRRFRYLLEGATPEELQQLTSEQLHDSRLFKARLGKLQIRTLFDIMHPHNNLTSENLVEQQLLPVALQLSPGNLQKFNIIATDFEILSPLLNEKCSYSTALQILESLIARSVFVKKLKSIKPATWGSEIKHLGKFVYVLPLSALESYRLNAPSLLAQSSVDSDMLSPRQARLLAGRISLDLGNPDMMLSRRGLLKALESSQIANKGTLPQNVLSHLLSNLPSGMPMQTATLVLKAGKLKGKSWALKSIFSNKNPNQYFDVMDSQTVAMLETDIIEMKGFDNAIKSLSQNTLSALLTSQRTKFTNQNILWSSDTLLSENNRKLLLGLSCNDIYAMETVDFMYILEMYNRERKLLKKPFPKDLQYCSQMALMNYLEMKASLQDDGTLDQLLDYLEPADIESVGGYILGNLPNENINQSKWKREILEAIGQLALPEIIVATKEECPWKYAALLMQQYDLLNHEVNIKELFGLGNLFQFLSSDDIIKINPASFKLFLESLGDPRSKAVCADSSTRSAWYQLVLKSFGEPFKWTAGVLETLGDMLVVVPYESLMAIPSGMWKTAADVLIDKTSYHLKLEWPGNTEQVHFYQACAELLDMRETPHYVSAVRELVRWYMSAVQDQLNTVATATHLLGLTSQAMKGRKHVKIKDFTLEAVRPAKVIKILDAGIEKPERIDKHKGNTNEDDDDSKEDYEYKDALETTTEMQTTTETQTESSSSGAASTFSLSTEYPSLYPITPPYTNEATSPKIILEDSLSTVQTEIMTTATNIVSSTKETTDTVIDLGSTISELSENTKITSTTEVDSNTVIEIGLNDSQISTDLPRTTLSFTTAYVNEGDISNSSLGEIGREFLSLLNESVLSDVTSTVAPVTMDISNTERVLMKRHASMDGNSEPEIHKNVGTNPAEHSGDILRKILISNKIVTKADQSQMSTESGEVAPTEKPQVWKLYRRRQKLSCNTIKAAGPAVAITLDVTDIEHMDVKELEDCLETLGSLELDKTVQKKIWEFVNKEKYFENLSDLGYLVKILHMYEVEDLNLNIQTPYALDNLAILSKMVTDDHVLQEIAQHFVRSNPDLNSFTTEVTIALGRILCDVVEVKSLKLHDLVGQSVFLRASPILGRMKNCPTHCLHKLAHAATRPSEYGRPDSWTAEDVATLGIIVAGLKAEQWKQLRSTGYGNNPLVGLQPIAVKYIPPQIFKELNEDQLKSLPTLSAAVVSEGQISHLSESQEQALMRVQREVPVLRRSDNEVGYRDFSTSSSASVPVTSVCLLIVTLVVLL